MANLVYNNFKEALLKGSFDGGGSPTLYHFLVGSGYTAVDTHAYRSEVNNEIAGSNYTQGGYPLSSPNVQEDGALNQGILYATQTSLQNITFDTDARAAVIYGSSGLGVDSDPLVAYIDFTTDQAVTAGTFQITWNANGILALT